MEERLIEIEQRLLAELNALLGGVNFSGYTERARLRSDDLAVRECACADVLGAKAHVARVIARWSAANIDDPTREQPFPPAASVAALRAMRGFETQLGEIESAIRGAEAPDYDNVWNTARDGAAVLRQLLQFDHTLIERAKALRDSLGSVTAGPAEADPFVQARPLAAEIEALVRDRQALLRAVTVKNG